MNCSVIELNKDNNILILHYYYYYIFCRIKIMFI